MGLYYMIGVCLYTPVSNSKVRNIYIVRKSGLASHKKRMCGVVNSFYYLYPCNININSHQHAILFLQIQLHFYIYLSMYCGTAIHAFAAAVLLVYY